jgi:endonuclease/exonuclease/phosphatase (EEP) superfamily protein YafD
MPNRIDESNRAPEPTPPPGTPRWRRLASRLTLILGIAYALGVVGIWLFLHLAGDYWWPATFLLFSPRWIWIVPAFLVLPPAIVFRRRWAWLPALTGFFVLFALMGFSIPWRLALPQKAAKGTVRIVTANLHGREADAAIVNDFLTRTQPDVVVLEEFDPRMQLPYVRQPGWHLDYAASIFIASRWPIAPHKGLDLEEPPESPEELRTHINIWGSAVRWLVYSPAGTFQVVGLHLISPHAALSMTRKDRERAEELLNDNAARRAHELQVLRKRIAEVPGPVILAGDFNTTDDSPIFRQAFPDLKDAFSAAGFGFGTTYVKHRTWLRIDHILFDSSWECRRCYTSQDVGSGHRAVLAELSR